MKIKIVFSVRVDETEFSRVLGRSGIFGPGENGINALCEEAARTGLSTRPLIGSDGSRIGTVAVQS